MTSSMSTAIRKAFRSFHVPSACLINEPTGDRVYSCRAFRQSARMEPPSVARAESSCNMHRSGGRSRIRPLKWSARPRVLDVWPEPTASDTEMCACIRVGGVTQFSTRVGNNNAMKFRGQLSDFRPSLWVPPGSPSPWDKLPKRFRPLFEPFNPRVTLEMIPFKEPK